MFLIQIVDLIVYMEHGTIIVCLCHGIFENFMVLH